MDTQTIAKKFRDKAGVLYHGVGGLTSLNAIERGITAVVDEVIAQNLSTPSGQDATLMIIGLEDKVETLTEMVGSLKLTASLVPDLEAEIARLNGIITAKNVKIQEMAQEMSLLIATILDLTQQIKDLSNDDGGLEEGPPDDTIIGGK